MKSRWGKGTGIVHYKWSREQKLNAVSIYLSIGNMSQVSEITKIPLHTLNSWKASDWFKSAYAEFRDQGTLVMSAKMKKIIEKSMLAIEDRLDLGDAQYNQKTGEMARVPVKAQVALRITKDLLEQQKALETSSSDTKELEKTIDERLLKLSLEFAQFAKDKNKKLKDESAIDVEANFVGEGNPRPIGTAETVEVVDRTEVATPMEVPAP